MRDRKFLLFLILGALGLLSLACAGSSAPSGYATPVEKMAEDGFGGWVSVGLKHDKEVKGELIAISENSIYLLEADTLVELATKDVARIRLEAYRREHGSIMAWGFLGTLSTISHGLGLIISAPLWIISSTATAAGVSRNPMHEFPDESLADLRKFARFPQGLPAGEMSHRLKAKTSAKAKKKKKKKLSESLPTLIPKDP